MSYTKQLQFIEKSISIYGTEYDYSNVKYVNSKTKVEVICKKHGSFMINPIAHTYHKQGCKQCGIQRRSNKKRLTQDQFIQQCFETHGTQYTYSDVKYTSKSHKINVICKQHGSFSVRAGDHIHKKSGCPKCKAENFRQNLLKSQNQFIHDSNIKHKNAYDYSKSKYIDSHTKVEIVCKKHGSFFQRPYSHTNAGLGCPLCNTSKGEQAIIDWCNCHNLEYHTQYTFTKCVNPKTQHSLKFDFFIPSKNTLIEYDGIQHFQFIPMFYKNELEFYQSQERDRIKNEFAYNNNINMIRIRFDENVEITLNQKLL